MGPNATERSRAQLKGPGKALEFRDFEVMGDFRREI